MIEWLERFARAIAVLHSPRRLIISVALTCLGWAVFGASVMTLVVAFHLPAPAASGLIVVVTTNLGAAIPSLPGSLGVYHFLAVLALSPWQVDTSLAVAFAIVTHAMAIGFHIVLGSAAAWIEGVGLTSLSRVAQTMDLQGDGDDGELAKRDVH
jgi:uncharacterized protein (TIRG00374 family)